MILPKIRDKRFITVRRGGTLPDEDHHLLAVWAALCAQNVLHCFEEVRPNDDRPRRAIELTHAWVNGVITMKQARMAAGQAAVVAHVAAHELGAAAYAIRAVMAAAPDNEKETVRLKECQWQRDKIPEGIRDLVLDDQRLRNDICWFVFS